LASIISRGIDPGRFGFHFPKGYISAALAFFGAAEGLYMLARRTRKQPPK
jgi:hypothetical protein